MIDDPEIKSSANSSILTKKIEADLQKAEIQKNRAKIEKYIRSTPKFEEMYQQQKRSMKSTSLKISAENVLENFSDLQKDFQQKGLNQNHLKLIDKLIEKRAVNAKFQKSTNLAANILRGRLGVDVLFLGFAVTGMFLIPSYFYFKQREHKKYISEIKKTFEKDNKNREIDIDETSLDFYVTDPAKIKLRILSAIELQENLSFDGKNVRKFSKN